MNKYTKQAILTLVKTISISVTMGIALAVLTTLVGLSTVIYSLCIAVFLFCSYKYVKIQAEINERLDKLKNK